MSHIVKAATQIKNVDALNRALSVMQENGVKASNLGVKSHRLYEGDVHGLGVQLPGWRYPVVIDTNTGEAKYDNYGGSWGKQQDFDDFLQRYGLEAAKMAAEGKGYSYEEEYLNSGDIKLKINIGGGLSAGGASDGMGGPFTA